MTQTTITVAMSLALGLLWSPVTIAQDEMGGAEAQPAAQTETSQTETAQPEAAQPETAQPETADAVQPEVESSEAEPSEASIFTDPDFERIAEMLSGSWKSTSPVPGAADETEVVLTFAPINIPGMTDTIYTEAARADETDHPYDVTVHQFVRTRDGVRLRTYRLNGAPDENRRALAGHFALPTTFEAEISPEQLFPTLDYLLFPTTEGYAGRTRNPYPTSFDGAIEFRGKIEFGPDTLVLQERGYDADGNTVWGAQPTTYERIDPIATYEYFTGGMHVVTYAQGTGMVGKTRDFVVIHYDGYLPDGRMFDSSIENGEPFRYQLPGRLIRGWINAVENPQAGKKMRLFIPSNLAYQSVGSRNELIGPDQNLRFMLDIIAVEPGE